MTAVAKLRDLAASWRREADDMERAGVSTSTTLAIRANADELTAALSPAELGGVEAVVIETVGFVRWRRDELEIDWTMEGGIHALEAGCELLASSVKLTNDEGYGEVYTTPRAAEAVSEEAIGRAMEAHADEMERQNESESLPLMESLRECMRAALTAALTPPSAKGEL